MVRTDLTREEYNELPNNEAKEAFWDALNGDPYVTADLTVPIPEDLADYNNWLNVDVMAFWRDMATNYRSSKRANTSTDDIMTDKINKDMYDEWDDPKKIAFFESLGEFGFTGADWADYESWDIDEQDNFWLQYARDFVPKLGPTFNPKDEGIWPQFDFHDEFGPGHLPDPPEGMEWEEVKNLTAIERKRKGFPGHENVGKGIEYKNPKYSSLRRALKDNPAIDKEHPVSNREDYDSKLTYMQKGDFWRKLQNHTGRFDHMYTDLVDYENDIDEDRKERFWIQYEQLMNPTFKAGDDPLQYYKHAKISLKLPKGADKDPIARLAEQCREKEERAKRGCDMLRLRVAMALKEHNCPSILRAFHKTEDCCPSDRCVPDVYPEPYNACTTGCDSGNCDSGNCNYNPEQLVQECVASIDYQPPATTTETCQCSTCETCKVPECECECV